MENEEVQDNFVEENENDDSLNVTEEEQQIDSDDGYIVTATGEKKKVSELSVEDYQKAVEELNKVKQTNKKLYARIKKPTMENQTLKTANPDDGWREKLELKVEGYSDDEIAFIQQNGGRKGLENPLVKTAIESIRTQKQAESAVVDTDTTKSEVERKYTPEQLKNMPLSELEKLLPRA